MISGVLAVKAIGVSDAYFVGQLGEARLAAISYTFPVVMTLISLAIGLSAGASSVLSRAIGADASAEKQAEIVTGAAGMAVLVSIAMSVLGFLFIDMFLRLLDEVDNISHPQNTVCHRLWVEELEVGDLLPNPFKHERLPCHFAD